MCTNPNNSQTISLQGKAPKSTVTALKQYPLNQYYAKTQLIKFNNTINISSSMNFIYLTNLSKLYYIN